MIRQLLDGGRQGQQVTVCGWVRTKRESKNFSFIALNDGSCQQVLQVILDEGSPDYLRLKEVLTGCALKVEGVLQASPAKGQVWEVQGQRLEILGPSGQDYPLQKKGHSLEFLREIAHLRPRTNTFGAVFRVRNVLAQQVHQFFSKRGFLWAHTPILTASDCEGAGEMFTVSTLDPLNHPKTKAGQVDYSADFFGKKAHLTVSGQLEAEFMALSMGRVYTFGPTFRAENSNTARHLAEFWMVEPEMAFADLCDDMDLAESFIKDLVAAVLKGCPDELAFFEKIYKNIRICDLEALVEDAFARISYTEAIDILKGPGQTKFEYSPVWGADLQTEHERFLSEKVFKKPVIVRDYPKDIKAFYMRQNDDDKTVAAMDVLVPGVGELIGGSQREDRLELLESRMDLLEVPREELQWYLDLRRYGSAPHAGFGMGFERMVMYITGMHNIRDSVLCPRSPGSIGF